MSSRRRSKGAPDTGHRECSTARRLDRSEPRLRQRVGGEGTVLGTSTGWRDAACRPRWLPLPWWRRRGRWTGSHLTRTGRCRRRRRTEQQSIHRRTARCVEKVAADEILLLPNNSNVVLAARQATEMTNRRFRVVPTRNAAEGFRGPAGARSRARRHDQRRGDDARRTGSPDVSGHRKPSRDATIRAQVRRPDHRPRS